MTSSNYNEHVEKLLLEEFAHPSHFHEFVKELFRYDFQNQEI